MCTYGTHSPVYCILCKCSKTSSHLLSSSVFVHLIIMIYLIEVLRIDMNKQHFRHKWSDSAFRWAGWLACSHLASYTLPLCCFTSTVNEVLSPLGEKLLYVNWERRSCALSPHKLNLSPVTFSISVDKLLIVFPLSRMCCPCLTLPPPRGRWYNGC